MCDSKLANREDLAFSLSEAYRVTPDLTSGEVQPQPTVGGPEAPEIPETSRLETFSFNLRCA
jgi:hypothetical protein